MLMVMFSIMLIIGTEISPIIPEPVIITALLVMSGNVTLATPTSFTLSS